jgi:hypothetical protein
MTRGRAMALPRVEPPLGDREGRGASGSCFQSGVVVEGVPPSPTGGGWLLPRPRPGAADEGFARGAQGPREERPAAGIPRRRSIPREGESPRASADQLAGAAAVRRSATEGKLKGSPATSASTVSSAWAMPSRFSAKTKRSLFSSPFTRRKTS